VFTQRFLVSALVLACGAIPASATLTTYSSLSAFTAGNTDQTFQNITFPSGNNGTTYTDPTTGVVFSDATSLIGIGTPSGWPAGSSLQATHCGSPGSCTTTLTITLPATVTSVAMDLGLSGFNAFQVTVSNGVDAPFSSNQEQSSLSTPLFYGFASTSPFTTFTISTEDPVNDLLLDAMEIGTPTSGGSGGGGDPPDTPEVATLLMIGSGLVMLRCGRRWMPRAR
jgi:hypothetical protein